MNRQSSFSVDLDIFRGAAAIFVLLSHWRALFFVEYAQNQAPGILTKCFYFFTALGHEAVIIFFVLSGLLISSGIHAAIKDKRWYWPRYGVARLSRLYAVLIPALILNLILDQAGVHFFGESGIYGGEADTNGIVVAPVRERLDALTFFCNAFFLQGVFAPTFGSNGPLWSLTYEFWYYVAFPFLALGLSRQALPTYKRWIYVISMLILFIALGKTIALYFLIWLVGPAVAAISARLSLDTRAKIIVSLSASTVLFAAALVISRIHLIGNQFIEDGLIAVAFASLLIALSQSRTAAANPGYMRLGHLMANSSYTLYLVHLPLLVFINAALIGTQARWQLSSASVLPAIAILTGTAIYAYVIARITEARTIHLRNWVASKLNLNDKNGV